MSETKALLKEPETVTPVTQSSGILAAFSGKRTIAAIVLLTVACGAALVALSPARGATSATMATKTAGFLNFDEVAPAGSYKCGRALVAGNQLAFIKHEYSAWKAKYVKNVQDGMCVMRPPGDVSGNPKYQNDCVSEGIGYGLLLAAYLDDRDAFEGFWKFAQKYKDNAGNMHWQIWPNHPNPIVGKGSATDVDEDTAMALLVAAEKWGGNYAALARQQIDRVLQYDIKNGAWMPGDEWGDCGVIDVSYFAPAWYETFAKVTGNQEWRKVVDFGYQFMGKCNQHNQGTGLTPQWTDCECANSKQIGKYPDKYWCDASRVPWRLGVSAAWHCNGAAHKQVELLSAFFSKQGGAAKIQNGYTLDGQPLHTTDTDNACTESCFITMAAAAMVSSESVTAETRADFWNVSARPLVQEQSCYYCDTLRLLSLLFTSGLMKEPTISV